jgi:pyruvate/2-oxoglutarate dehydrogenase complex dihydrolipoamide dehydrogenase (E3) component
MELLGSPSVNVNRKVILPPFLNIFAVAVRFGIRADALKQMLFAYPTSASDIVHML